MSCLGLWIHLDELLVVWPFQVRGELPFQKCKAAVDSVEFVEKPSHRVVASTFADIVTQMAQDVSFFFLGPIVERNSKGSLGFHFVLRAKKNVCSSEINT